MHAAQKPGTITSMSRGIARTWIKSHRDLLVLWLSWVPETLKKVLFSGTQGSWDLTKKSQATTQRSFAKSMFDLQHDNSDSVSPAERLATYLMTTWLPRLELISQGNTYLVAGPIKPFYSHTFIRHWNACVYEQTDAVAHLYELYAWTSTFPGMQKSDTDTQRQRHQKRDFQVANLETIKTSIFSSREEKRSFRLHQN